MGIDGIGKPPPISPATGPAAPSASGGEFSVGAAAGSQPSGELARLERGEIGLDAYLDAKVGEATRHLAGTLSGPQLDFVKETLRAELAQDPVLVELVRRTTGKTAEITRE